MSITTVYFVSGGNRGIGYCFVKQLSSDPQNLVIVSARNPEKATELQDWSKKHPNIKIVKLDVSDEDSIAGLPDQVSKFTDGIDVLISNAGIINDKTKSLLETPASVMKSIFTVNSIGSILLVGVLKPFLSKRETPKTIFMSSIAGSIGGFDFDTFGAYGASKAALNYYMKVLAIGLKNHIFISMHPGLVSTDMGKEAVNHLEADKFDLTKLPSLGLETITPDESASSVLKVIEGLTIKDSGSFLDYRGARVPF